MLQDVVAEIALAGPDGAKRVPTGWGMRRGAAQAEPPVAKKQVGPTGGKTGQRVIRGSVDLQQQGQAMQHAAVVLGQEGAGGTARSMYCARGLAQHRSNNQATWRSGRVGEARGERGAVRKECEAAQQRTQAPNSDPDSRLWPQTVAQTPNSNAKL